MKALLITTTDGEWCVQFKLRLDDSRSRDEQIHTELAKRGLDSNRILDVYEYDDEYLPPLEQIADSGYDEGYG